jgi:hypothetical protein
MTTATIPIGGVQIGVVIKGRLVLPRERDVEPIRVCPALRLQMREELVPDRNVGER